MNHNEVVDRCIELDKMNEEQRIVVYFLDCNKNTFKLGWSSLYWSQLAESERYCMVNYGNYFLNEEDAKAAVERALSK